MKKLMKKTLTRLALAGGTLAVIIAGAAAFSAFEAHVVNVTATIENALTVPVEQNGLTFGEMFPEEVGHVTLPISLSDSFMSTERVDDVEYIIRQKPKCGIPVPSVASGTPVSYSGFTQVTEDGNTFVCPAGSVQLPLLCPYLSKNELNPAGAPTGNGIAAFHGLPGPWTETTTENTQVAGVLSKELGKTSTNWDIDLHTPCFKGQCSQDWASFVTKTNASVTDPTLYEADPANEHAVFGCDLWIEVTNISLPTTTTGGILTVTKIVDNTGGGTKQVSDFPLFVDGASVTSGVATTTSIGTHQVTETSNPNYTAAFSGNCTSVGSISVTSSTPASCVLTNTFNASTTLTINKVLSPSNDSGLFNLQIDGSTAGTGTNVGNGGTTGPVVVTTGAHTIGEIAGTATTLANYTAVIGGDCAANGSITLTLGQHAVCTITNTRNGGGIVIHKVVNNNGVGTKTAGDFQMTIDSSNVSQDATNTVTTGLHTVGEVADSNYTSVISGDCAPDGTVTIASNQVAHCTITNSAKFATLTITKVVNNIHGGNNIVSDFQLFASGNSGSTQFTSGISGNVVPGIFFINEEGVSGYVAVFTGDCDANGQITLAAGDNKQCTITNTDLPANITLIKAVDSGTAKPTDFLLRIDGSFAPQNSSVQVTSNSAHAINEDAHTGYHFVSITGDALCPSVLGGTVTLNEGQSITCTIHNTANTP